MIELCAKCGARLTELSRATDHSCAVCRHRPRAIQYSERIDAVIYDSPATRDLTRDEWFEVAVAALDQAGLPARTQEELRNYFKAWKGTRT